MKKYNLKDITFIIPVHCDSIIRLENTISIISFLSKYFDSNIFVLEISQKMTAMYRNHSIDLNILTK